MGQVDVVHCSDTRLKTTTRTLVCLPVSDSMFQDRQQTVGGFPLINYILDLSVHRPTNNTATFNVVGTSFPHNGTLNANVENK